MIGQLRQAKWRLTLGEFSLYPLPVRSGDPEAADFTGTLESESGPSG